MVMMRKRLFRNVVYGLSAIMLIFLVGSCGEPVGGMGKSPVYLTTKGQNAWAMAVDVYNPAVTGGVSDDLFWITITSNYKNSELATPYADVILQEYRVSYYRADGRLPVPDPFVVHFSGTVPAGGTYDHETIVLRRDAKLESPLRELVFGGGEGYIDLNAIIDFYGEDLMGNEVSARYNLLLKVSDIS
jgi:hypothetical protein